jgi:hypothetical protein
MSTVLRGTGEVFRRDEGRESLCACEYELTSTSDAPLPVSTLGKTEYLQSFVEIYGTITPKQGMTTTALRKEADQSGTLEMCLADNTWIDFQFVSRMGNRVRCSNGPREAR